MDKLPHGLHRRPAGKLKAAAQSFFQKENAAPPNLVGVNVFAQLGKTEDTYWPENAQVIYLFIQLLTQWRVGMSGPTGLDYAAVYPLLDRKAADSEEWDQLFDDLRVMESAALEAIADQREQT